MIAALDVDSLILSVHIAAVVVAFGPLFAYPALAAVVRRSDPAVLPVLHRAQHRVAKWVITPALPTILAAGIYLSASEHVFGQAWVIFPIVAIVVLMALHRLVLLRGYRKLSEPGAAEAPLGRSLAQRVTHAEILAALLALATILVMTAKP